MIWWLRLRAPNAGDPGSIPGQGTRSHMPQLRACVLQLRVRMPQLKDPACRNEDPMCCNRRSQINKYFFFFFKEIIAENVPNLGRELDIQVQEANRTLIVSMQKDLFQDSVLKLSKVNDKERILKQPGKKGGHLQRNPH